MAELIVVSFDEGYRAAEVVRELEAMQAALFIELQDAVAVYRTDDGKLQIDKSVRRTTEEGARRGALLGGLLGAILFAPVTAGASVAGAAAVLGAGAATLGATGAVFGADEAQQWKEAAGITDDFVRQVAGMVQPGQSAVFVLAEVKDRKFVEDHFRGYGGKLLRSSLAPDAAKRFEELMMA